VQDILLPTLSAQERKEVVELCWFDMIEGGIKGLIHYDVESNKWLQAHIGASYAIFSVLRKEGGIFEIKETQKNGKPYLEIILNKESIYTKGKKAIGEFLKHLQVYKSTADFKNGSQYFQQFLEVIIY
jgi:dipeptidyl-peptidase-3